MLHDPPPDKRPWDVLWKYLGQIVRTRRNPASQTIIRRLSQCSSGVHSIASPAIIRMSHFPVTTGKSAGFAVRRGLTGRLPDVGTDRALHRNLIRDQHAALPARNRLQGAVIAVSVQCLSPCPD